MSNHATIPAPDIPASLPEALRSILSKGELIDIITTGRTSGQAHRVELVYHTFDGRLYISGRPGRRDWYANLVADPRFTFRLKGTTIADLAATARPTTDPAERRDVLAKIAEQWRTDAEPMIARSPLVEVTILEQADAA